MNKLLLTLILAAISISTASAGDGRYFTKLIYETDAPLRLTLPAHRYMRISNFTQSGVVQSEPGVFTVGAVYVYKGESGFPGITALTASLATTTHVQHEDTYVAGTSTVYVPPIAGATLMITYFLANQ